MTQTRRHRLLVVDDDEDVRTLHSHVAETLGYDSETAADGIEAMAKMALDIDLILLDADMPNMDGFEVARRIRADPAHAHLPIVMVSGLTRPEDRRRAMEVGVNDFVGKPINADEFALRARWLLELKAMYDRLHDQGAQLERTVARRTEALRDALQEMAEAQRLTHQAHFDTIRRLMIASEYKDHATAGHIQRIGRYSELLARASGLPPGTVELLLHAAPMHDVGKLGIPDRILLKPGSLDEDEWDIMRAHTVMGATILSGSAAPVIQLGRSIALTHHERWDGSGYPAGLREDAIPLEGRICAVVDFFDAVTMDRPYRAALSNDEAFDLMREGSGRHFDPAVLDTFFANFDGISAIQNETH